MPATVDARQPILPTASSSNLTDKHCHISANFSTAYITEWLPAVISRSGLCFVRVGFVYGIFDLDVTAFIDHLLLSSISRLEGSSDVP